MTKRNRVSSLLAIANQIPLTRQINLHKTLSRETAKHLFEELLSLQKDAGLILFNVSCFGGHFDAGIRMYRAFRACPNRIIGRVTDEALSAGFMALQGCDIRIAGTDSKLYIHNPIGYNVQSPAEYNSNEEEFLEKQRAFFRKIQPVLVENRRTMIEVLLVRSRLSIRKLEGVLKKDKPMTADEALELGFIDAIV